MFKWRKKAPSYEPKTPKLANVSLPDDRYTPMPFHSSYSEIPPTNLLLRRVTPDRRGTTPSRSGTPSWKSRMRTMSTPVRNLEAPRPIRPHPSQGPYVPVLDNPHRIRIEPTLGPISVPSAQYLEEQIRNHPVDLGIVQPKQMDIVHKMLHGPEYEYPEETKLKEVAKTKKGAVLIQRQLSKAYLEVLDEQKQERERSKAPSAPPMKKGKFLGLFSPGPSTTRQSMAAPSKGWQGKNEGLVDFDSWKPVPVTTTPPKPAENDLTSGLKSALKKRPSTRDSSLKPALKNGSANESRTYYSEDESARSKTERMKPLREIQTAPKAFLEEQQERQERERGNRGWSSQHQSHPAQARPVYGPAAFAPTNSSTTPSPTDSVLVDHRRPRRSIHQDPRIPSSNYMPAYIKDDYLQDEFLRNKHQMMTWESDPPIHGNLTWLLVDYDTRKRAPEPPIYFDAGFNPRIPQYAVTKRGIHGYPPAPITREEETLPVCMNARIVEMSIICRKLDHWPIIIKRTHHIVRVVDIFRVIYDTYSQPLTQRELMNYGPEYVQRCQRAFLQRCKDTNPSDYRSEERKGMLRIDVLRGRRIFKGLFPVPKQPHTFELIFDDGR